jgi:ATP-dependent helicase/nuclease subunit A
MDQLNIPIKPEEVTWTDDQWKAIYASGRDILVAAAAGSGKTAVLVERIIQKILAEKDPIDVDQLLVVTFTNASAAEMRHRIREALEKAIAERPHSAHLRRQLSLVNKASISTLHSFCLEVIRKYYYLIDIDPSFRIADETEAELIRDDVLDELMEDEYGKEGNDGFYRLVDTFTNDRSDVELQTLVRKIYDFSRSHPVPDRWLDQLINMYDVQENTTIDDLPFIDYLKRDVQLQLEGAKRFLQEAYEGTKKPGGPAPRAENYLDDLQIIERLERALHSSWEDLYVEMQAWKFTRAKSCRGDEFDKELVDYCDSLRKKAKGMLEKLKTDLFSRKPEFFLRDMREMKPIIAELVTLVKKFHVRFTEAKREKGLVDFNDLEHYCLAILRDPQAKEGELLPSEAAMSYRYKFKEVLVDEYQDTNMVQEAILQLVKSEKGNLFMVGDVKQSIYRFRLAEPNLFLSKYRRFRADGKDSGLRIDLAKNFRSRKEVLDGTNFLFKQIMGTTVGEIEYDNQAELVKGAPYPDDDYPVEVILIDHADETSGHEEEGSESSDRLDQVELEQSQVEARLMAKKVKELIEQEHPIFDPKTKTYRPIRYKDIVILLRSMPWAPTIMEEFKKEGIPLYANLSTGYFEAIEVSIMLSLLQIIDNPYQDIPFAAVLRSPIVGLDEEQLAQIRIHSKKGSFYEAAKQFVELREQERPYVHEKLDRFLRQFEQWRTIARQGTLSELIWQLYRDTRFYDFVGGLPGGKQRQANLRALYDRAKQYEATSFRGLFRFLRFIERMRDRGDDLGAARALGEQEDVVRLMTIHSSKGLEFPIVFVAGLGKPFNKMDIMNGYLLDKDYGFASPYIHPDKRISYPSLPQLALKRKKWMELIAEEMRILYVALTRAKEKLILVGSLKKAEKSLQSWKHALQTSSWLLNDYDRAKANCYLDWIGPALVRHLDGRILIQEDAIGLADEIRQHPSKWQVQLVNKQQFNDTGKQEQEDAVHWETLVQNGKPIDVTSLWKNDIYTRMEWQYTHVAATKHRSKQSVSEIKRLFEWKDELGSDQWKQRKMKQKAIFKRPLFLQEKKLTPAEKGTAMHVVMQHISLSEQPTISSIEDLLYDLVRREILSEEQKAVIDPYQILAFFNTEIGKRILQADHVLREIPFSFGVPATDIYPDWQGDSETILVQGVIDCLIKEKDQLILLDYKTDAITDRFLGGFAEAKPILQKRYETQIALYAQAVEQIVQQPIIEKYLYFFDGGHLLSL